MICSQCGKFYLKIVPTRCSCGGLLQPESAQQQGVTADLLPAEMGLPAAQGGTTQIVYEAMMPRGMAWLTPSLLGDAVTHPTSPYGAVEIGAPPPPPAGLVQWHKVPDPKRLAQMTFALLSVGLLALMASSARVAPFSPSAHTAAQAQRAPAQAIKQTVPEKTPASVTPGPAPHTTAVTPPIATVQYTVQLSVPSPSATHQTKSAQPVAQHPKHGKRHKLASMPLRGAGNSGKGHKSPGRQGHHPHK